MSVETHFYNWGALGDPDDPKYHQCSPNLVQLGNYLGRRFAMTNNGCYGQRPIRGGTTPSTHWWGAATDRNYPDRLIAKNTILPFLIDNSHELHVQAIHDYFGSRIWRAGRTSNVADAHTLWWKPNTTASGMGESWATYFHIETYPAGWGDASDITTRVGPGTVPPTTIPPSGGLVFTRNLKKGDTGADVGFIQAIIHAPGSATGIKTLVVDGNFGTQTDTAVKNMQKWWGLTADGIVGPQTQAKFMQLANT